MADWAFYWPQYLNESGQDGEPVTGWLTSRDWLVNRIRPGDRVWLFIGGDACEEQESSHQAYVAQLLVVDSTGTFADYDPDVPGSPRYHIHGVEDRCILVKPPAFVDSIFRRLGTDPEQHIGIARQTPFELKSEQVARLLALLGEEHPDVHETATST